MLPDCPTRLSSAARASAEARSRVGPTRTRYSSRPLVVMGAMNVVKPLAFMSCTRRWAFSLLLKLPSCTTKLPRAGSVFVATCGVSTRAAGTVAATGDGGDTGPASTGTGAELAVAAGADGATAASPGTAPSGAVPMGAATPRQAPGAPGAAGARG